MEILQYFLMWRSGLKRDRQGEFKVVLCFLTVPVALLLAVRSFGFLVLIYPTSLSYPVNHHWARSVI